MDSCCAYVTVAGTTLASLPYFHTGRPFVGWVASGWHMDRKDRVKQFSLGRKVVDHAIVSPVARRLERSILRSGSVLSLSHYTRRLLDGIAGAPVVRDVLPMPVDVDFFSPAPDLPVSRRVGFSGRLDDPRKNLRLLLAALHQLRRADHAVSALLIGGEPDQKLRRHIAELGIGDTVEFCGFVSTAPIRLRWPMPSAACSALRTCGGDWAQLRGKGS